jgi:lamin tail-like protein
LELVSVRPCRSPIEMLRFFVLSLLASLVCAQVLLNKVDVNPDLIEVVNLGSTDVDLQGYHIVLDNLGASFDYTVPVSTVVPAGTAFVFYEEGGSVPPAPCDSATQVQEMVGQGNIGWGANVDLWVMLVTDTGALSDYVEFGSPALPRPALASSYTGSLGAVDEAYRIGLRPNNGDDWMIEPSPSGGGSTIPFCELSPQLQDAAGGSCACEAQLLDLQGNVTAAISVSENAISALVSSSTTSIRNDVSSATANIRNDVSSFETNVQVRLDAIDAQLAAIQDMIRKYFVVTCFNGRV